MGEIYAKIAGEFGDAKKRIFSAEHLASVVYPAVKDAKLLLKSLEELEKGVIGVMRVCLKIEHLFKRVNLSEDKKENLRIFFEKVALRYGIEKKDAENIQEILNLGRKHRESGFEFSKWGNAIILNDELEVIKVDAVKLKELLGSAKAMIARTELKTSEVFCA